MKASDGWWPTPNARANERCPRGRRMEVIAGWSLLADHSDTSPYTPQAMKKAVKTDYTNDYDKMVKAYAKLLNEFDRLEATRTKIADTEKRLRDKPSASKARKLERMRKEYEKDHADWKEREAKLLELKLRNDPDKPEA